MKFTGQFLATAFVAVVMSSVGFAGQSAVRFKVPFAFEAGGTKLPAGEYQVVENSAQTIKITGIDSKKQVLLSDNVGAAFGNPDGDAQVVFKAYGDRYFLHQVYEGNSNKIHEFSGTKAERAVRTAFQQEPRTVVLAAK